jgi:hypothetical protein
MNRRGQDLWERLWGSILFLGLMTGIIDSAILLVDAIAILACILFAFLKKALFVFLIIGFPVFSILLSVLVTIDFG